MVLDLDFMELEIRRRSRAGELNALRAGMTKRRKEA
jgi:hypothetical protein